MVGCTRKHKHKLWESTYLSVYLSINLSIYLFKYWIGDLNHIFFTEVDEMNKQKFFSDPKRTRAQTAQELKFSSDVS